MPRYDIPMGHATRSFPNKIFFLSHQGIPQTGTRAALAPNSAYYSFSFAVCVPSLRFASVFRVVPAVFPRLVAAVRTLPPFFRFRALVRCSGFSLRFSHFPAHTLVSVSAMTYSASQKRLLLLHKSIKKRIMVIENPNPISLEYPTLLEVLKKELAQDPKKSLVSFCEKHSINYDHFNRWLRTTGRSFTRLCNEVRLKTGLPQNSNELYLNSLGLLKTELDNDINLRFVDFCERHNISYRGMANWLAINNMDFFSIRAQICAAKGIEVPKGSRQPYIPHPSNGDKAQARFGKTLDTYRKELDSNPRYSLKVHCARMGTSYYDMLRWMRFMKVSVRQLQKAASLNAKIPRQSSMVMVQFRPNGGTRSDMFRGVTISCPDGKSIHVEECSVIELCTFLYTYDKDQRRK